MGPSPFFLTDLPSHKAPVPSDNETSDNETYDNETSTTRHLDNETITTKALNIAEDAVEASDNTFFGVCRRATPELIALA